MGVFIATELQLDSEFWKAEISAPDVSGTTADAESPVLISNFKWGKENTALARCRALEYTTPWSEHAVCCLLCFTSIQQPLLIFTCHIILQENRQTVHTVQLAFCIFNSPSVHIDLYLHVCYSTGKKSKGDDRWVMFEYEVILPSYGMMFWKWDTIDLVV